MRTLKITNELQVFYNVLEFVENSEQTFTVAILAEDIGTFAHGAGVDPALVIGDLGWAAEMLALPV